MRFCDLYKMDIGEGNNISLALLLGDNMAIQSFFADTPRPRVCLLQRTIFIIICHFIKHSLLIHHSTLHYKNYFPECFCIFQRIAIHRYYIGEFVCFNATQLILFA